MLQFLKNIFFPKPAAPDPMKYLIVGLGNSAPEYLNTRHNIGFLVVDELAKEFEVSFKDDRLGFVTKFRHKGRSFHLLKPTTFMNRSGRSVLYWMQKLNLKPENLLVIVDDKNIDFKKIRIKGKGKDGGHNGLKDINEKLSSQSYARLRMGIGSNFAQGRQVDFVLGEWNSEEKDQLPPFLKRATEACKGFGTIGISRTMNQYNG